MQHVIPSDGDKPFYCPGIRAEELAGVKMLFGDTFLRGHITIFDRGQQRVGFMPLEHGPACP